MALVVFVAPGALSLFVLWPRTLRAGAEVDRPRLLALCRRGRIVASRPLTVDLDDLLGEAMSGQVNASASEIRAPVPMSSSASGR
ncbi:MAG: hypothetical protein ABI611_03675 [Solirubrobacteraceae bacterium]